MLNLFSKMNGVLSDKSILKYNKKGLLVEGSITEHQLQPNSVDLTLGMSYKKIQSNAMYPIRQYGDIGVELIDPKLPIDYEEGYFRKDNYNGEACYILAPGEFVLMASQETLIIPNGIVAFVCGRSSIARLAIQTEQAGLIDAGFSGTITFEIYNQGRTHVVLYPGMRLAQVYFFKAQKALVPYDKKKKSKYSKQALATESRIHLDEEFNK